MIEDFRTYLVEHGMAENTVKSYYQSVKAYLRWYSETFAQEAGQLYRANVLDYISYLRTVKELSNRSVNTKLAALQSLNDFWVSSGIQTEVVLSKKDYLKVQLQYANPSTVSKQQVEAFRQKVLTGQGKRDYAIVTILAYAGLRISACLALHTDDINLVARELRVRSDKGDKERVVFIGDKVVNAVREYLSERPKADCPYLFLSRTGGRLCRSQINRIFNAYSEEITPHTLRHFFCSSAIEAGYTIDEVANQAGHSNVHTTLLGRACINVEKRPFL